MELIKINSNNRPYYSNDFIKGFECGAKRQFEADKKARPKGDWVSEGRIYPPTNGYHGAVCSICGTESEYLTNFCGECGADMRKDESQTECDNDCPYRVDGLGCMRLGGCYKDSE